MAIPNPEQTSAGHSLYRLEGRIRVKGSHSRAIADLVEREWLSTHPHVPMNRRHLGVERIPATAWPRSVFTSRTPELARTDEQKAAVALAATLTDELVTTDALLSAAPLYNFGVSQHFWSLDLQVVEAEFTNVGVNPALDRFKDLARELRNESEEQARHAGRQLAAALALTPAV